MTTPQRVDILDQGWSPGEAKKLKLFAKDGATPPVAVDVNSPSPWSLRFRLFRFPNSPLPIFTKTTGAGAITIPAGVTGEYDVAVAVTDTGALAGGDYWYDSWRTDVGSESDIQHGYVRIGALTTSMTAFPGTFTYDPFTSGARDQVRLLIHDTDPNTANFADEELDVFLVLQGGVRQAAILAVGSLAVRFAQLADKQVGNLRISYSNRARAMQELMTALTNQEGLTVPVPYAGGISRSDKHAVAANTDRVQPGFTIGQDDYPGLTDPDPIDPRLFPQP